jgi:hypothetical protein
MILNLQVQIPDSAEANEVFADLMVAAHTGHGITIATTPLGLVSAQEGVFDVDLVNVEDANLDKTLKEVLHGALS